MRNTKAAPYAITTHVTEYEMARWLRLHGSRNVSRDLYTALNRKPLALDYAGIRYDITYVENVLTPFFDITMTNLIAV